MNTHEDQYLELLRDIMKLGARQKNRTGIDTFMIPGAMLKFDLREGFPAITTKKLAFRAVAAELCGFLRGYTSAADFRMLGCNIWDANANDPKANGGKWHASPHRKGDDDLGRIYGVQWRNWRGFDPDHRTGSMKEVDQLKNVLDTLENDPQSRRIIMNAWQPAELDQMALPPCHLLVQFLVQQEGNVLHACMYQRSCDMFLGVPFNIASYALLLSLVAKATGYTPGILTMSLADAHIYENHFEQVRLQLSREPYPSPLLDINFTGWKMEGGFNPLRWLETITPHDIWLHGYQHHEAIKAEMAA